ncbi:MAG: carboxypeptidase regulatory-like domain-containing protein [Pyrinomonadaceae bacterium]
MSTSILKCVFATLTVVVILSAAPLFGQDLDDVVISGRVTDPNGLPIVGATITVTLVETGTQRTVVTNDDGRYRVIELPPGGYSVKAAQGGFGARERKGLTAVAGQNLQLDFQLSPADVTAGTDVVVTEDDGPPVDITRTIVGGTVSQREIEELPNNSRNPLDLVLTLGGTTEEQLSTTDLAEDRNANPSSSPLEQGNFSLSGGTAYSNNITIDGLDNNDDRSSRDRFQPSIEAIVEVQVIQNQFSAEYGRASGGRVNIRTRAGGNRFRGRAFLFFRDDALNANSWYNNSRNIPRPDLRELTPGFSVSGPILIPGVYNGRRKSFFSATYEYNKLDDTTLIDTYIPVVANPNYTLPTPTGTEQFCDNSNPNNCPATAGFISPYSVLYATPNTNHVFTGRVDHQLFKNNEITFGIQFADRSNRRTNGNSTTRLEEAFQEKNNNTFAFNVTDNHVFGASTVNQFRMQWSQFKPSFQTADPLDPVVLVSFRDPVANSVRTLIAGNSTTSTSLNFSDSRTEKRWQVQDSVTHIWKSHTFKFGFDVQDVNSSVLGLEDATGTFNFGSVLQYSNNQVTRYRQNFGTAQDVTNTYVGIFFNDQFNLAQRLTVSAGLRYEKETAVEDDMNLGPRFGIAWNPFKKGSGVIRAGAGIFYNRVLLRTVADSIQNANANLINFDSNTIGTAASDPRRQAILAAISNNFPASYASIDELRTLVTTACATVTTTFPCNANTGFVTNVSSAGNPLRSVEENLKIPESYQFNVGFEKEIGGAFVFESHYTYNKTAHLWRDYNPNAPILPAGYADWTAYLLANPFDLSPTRRYTFYLGTNPADGSGIHTAPNGTTQCGTTTPNCFVNLNTINTSTTTPAVAVTGQNFNATGGPIGIALAAIARFRPDQTVEETSRIGSLGNAVYSGLVIEVRRRFRQLGYGFGSSMRVAYTLSSTKDDGLNNTANAEINGEFSREWARNLQDRRHRIAFTGTLETPYWLGKLRFSPLLRWGSSAPFNLSAGGTDRNLDDVSTDRLNFSGDLKDIKFRPPGSPVPDALIAQFSLQPIGSRSGNLPRNAGTGPSLFVFDLSVTREIKFSERGRIRPVAEFGNIFNSSVFSYGAEFINFAALRNDGTAPTATQLLARQNFLVPTRTYRQRTIRLGIRVDF